MLFRSVQAQACQPLVRAWLGTAPRPDELAPGSTVADGIAVLRPAIGDAVLRAVRSGDGAMVAVSDSELMEAVALLASTAGVGAEPAGAASVAGLRSALRDGLVYPDETIAVLVTGREIKAAGSPTRARVAVAERLDDVRQALGAPEV